MTKDIKDFDALFNNETSFAKQVDEVLSGTDTTSTHLFVMNTPLILRQVGANNLPVLITANHLKNIVADSGPNNNVNYHGLDIETVKRLPELLADPVMIMDSLTQSNSIVAVLSAVDNKNRPVIGAIRFDGFGNLNKIEIDANILTSTYGRNNFNDFIKRNVDENKILYWSKEKSQELIKTPGLQLPDNLNSLDSNIIIRQARAKVNTFSENNDENLMKIKERRSPFQQFKRTFIKPSDNAPFSSQNKNTSKNKPKGK